MSNLKSKLQDDLKKAMLSGDKQRAELLGMLKSAILYKEVELGARDSGLTDEQIIEVLAKEAKKRQEAAGMYKNAGDEDRTNKELSEVEVIQTYLPEQMSDEELEAIIASVIAEVKPEGMKDMGKVIGQVKAKTGSGADGARIAALVRQKLS